MTTKGDIEQLFRAHYAAMYRLAMLILRDDSVARDIVHDVFEALLAAGRHNVSAAYLLTAVRNRCLKHIRSLSVHDRIKAIYSISEQEIAADEWPDEETIRVIRTTVAEELTDACRRVVNLRYSEGKSYEEIARSLGISKTAVYKHLRRAIDILREKLSRNG